MSRSIGLVVACSIVVSACGQTSTHGDEVLAQAGSAGAGSLGGAGGLSGASSVVGGFGGTLMTSGGAGSSSGGGGAGSSAMAGETSVAGASGSAGACATGTTLAPWLGASGVVTLDAEDAFASDLSGLTYESPDVLWAVNNLSAKLYRLVKSGTGHEPDPMNDWQSGKRLRFPDGQRIPDAEGVTFAVTSATGVYVSSERDLNDADRSRLSVLRYDVSAAGSTLSATHEWDLTALLPPVGSNSGLEAITWAADSWLTLRGLRDESRGGSYRPSDYGEHGGGLFFVGVEQTGKVYAVALEHDTAAATVVATISTPLEGVMGLEHDRDAGRLWAYCDDTCNNRAAVLDIGPAGGFELQRLLAMPSDLPNSNHEGIALAPDSECSGGFKPFFWTDDADANGFSLRQGSVPCGCL